MKRLILAAVMVAVFATLAFAAHSQKGGEWVASGTTDPTITIVGAPASAFSIYAESADLTIAITGTTQDDGWPITVKAGTTVTMEGLSIYTITIDRTVATAYQLLWW